MCKKHKQLNGYTGNFLKDGSCDSHNSWLAFVIFKIWETEQCFEIINMDVMIKMMLLMMLVIMILLLENKREKNK